MRVLTTLAAICVFFSTGRAVLAGPVDEFYRGKTFNIYTGTGENSTGAVALYARAVSQVIGRHIPGSPQVVFRSMPGAGGIKAANFIYGIALLARTAQDRQVMELIFGPAATGY